MRHLTWARRLALGVAATAALFSFSSAVAQASTCGATWTGNGGDDLWSTPGNWSPADVPGKPINNVTYQPDVCIPAGSYTVLLNYATTVDSISVGAGSTFEIWGQQDYTHGGLTLNNQANGSGIASGAHVVLGTYDSNPLNETHGGFDVLAGTLTNNGSIVSATTGDETPNFITGNFDNAGTLTVNNALQGTVGAWTLGGTVTVSSGQAVVMSGPNTGSGSVNLTGTVTNTGTLQFQDAINVTATSGTDSGNPIVIGNGILSPSGSGTGTFHVTSGNAQLGSNIASGYTVWVSGVPGYTHGQLTPTGSYTNSGTLELGANDGTLGTLTVPSGDTFTNRATMVSENTGDETPNAINGNFDNTGTLTVNNDLQGTVGTWTLGGTVTVASGQAVSLSSPNSGSGSVNLTGTVTDTGSLQFGDAINVTATSGTDTGNPIVIGNGILSPSGSGSGTFHVMDGNGQLGSNIASGYTVWVSGIPGFTHGDLTPTGSYTNSGTLELGSLDGTHGTLTVPSGDTFTNNGSLIFENTANGPDGLNGALVNNASVSAQNQFTGAGAITNNGTFELTAASGNNSAASFTQGAAGTLKIDVTGGTSAVVPQLSLSSTATTAGTLVVDTTGGTATGTFPVIIASQQSGAFGTGFSGESYAVTYHDGTVSLTGPGSGSSGGGGSGGGGSSAIATTASAGGASTTGDSATLPVTCTGASPATCTITVSLTITETVKSGKITAVAAKAKAKPKVVRRTVTIGSANVTLAAGHTQTITVTLNGTGRSLLKQHHKLRVALAARLGTSVISSQTLTFTQPAKKKPAAKKHG